MKKLRELIKSKKFITAFLIVVLCVTMILSGGAEGDIDLLTEPSETEQIEQADSESLGLFEKISQSKWWEVTFNLLKGFRLNAVIFFVTLIFSLPLGMIVTFGLMSKIYPIRMFCKIIVWIVRGSPLLLQLYIVFYAPGLLFNIPMRDRMMAALIAFVINYSMYFAEIYRGALENIPKGQFEAGKVLGLSKPQVFFHVILFQVIKRITAPIGNEVLTLVKDTSLARVIAVQEILMQSTRYTAYGLIWPLFYSGVFFLAATALITILFEYLERRVSHAVGE